MVNTLPSTITEVQEQVTDMSFEFVGDISKESLYGVSMTGEIPTDNGTSISVLGSVVLNTVTGDLSEDSTYEPEVIAYPDGMLDDPAILLRGEEAVKFFEQTFTNEDHDSIYQARQDVDIDPSAM